MVPKFANLLAWQQAELLMQPVFIRVIDNIRKELEQSSWVGTYRDTPIWADDISPEIRVTVTQFQDELKIALPQRAIEIEAALAHLPQPSPGYELRLQHHDHEILVNLWQLCYQICFRNYNPVINSSDDQLVEIDTSLIDETGDVDWQRLDAKTNQLVTQLFASLPGEQ